jgi:hypothetical protein
MILFFDVWEGSLAIDEEQIEGHAAGFIIRLNDVRGGHHKDQNFDAQWAQSSNFYRAPYFVYNPWVSGAANFAWLQANCPERKVIFVDVELPRAGYSATGYARDFAEFYQLAKAYFAHVVIYTAEWFIPNLSSWPAGDYWWAQYLYRVYPATRIYVTWDALDNLLSGLPAKPTNAAKCPGQIVLWQVSGDRLQVPGTERSIDVNLWLKSAAEIDSYFVLPNEEPEPIPEPPPAVTNLYYVDALKWGNTHTGTKPPNGGPLTQPLTSKPGKSDNRVTLLKPWQDYIAHWNTPQDTARIFSKDFGPTFGFNANGLIYLGLAYPGPVAVTPRPNLVRVLAISGAWAKIDSLTTAQMPGANVTPQTYPWLFHTVYGSANNSGGYSVLNHTYTIPLICAAGLPWWIPTAILTKA